MNPGKPTYTPSSVVFSDSDVRRGYLLGEAESWTALHAWVRADKGSDKGSLSRIVKLSNFYVELCFH